MAQKFKKPELCKPCWELKYCPYGTLVEMMPLPPINLEQKRDYAEKYDSPRDDPEELYARAKADLQGTDFSNDDDIWRNMFFVMYADPFKWQALEPYDSSEISCNIFGHACPVFFFGALNVTETRELRRTGTKIPREIMLKVVRRDDYKCQKCGENIRDDELEFDHLIPHSKGGPMCVENIRLLCRTCNRKKSNSLEEILDLDGYEKPSES